MNPATSGLTCPKCHGSMRAYERGGVHIDQCTDCRGVFLDRGELERLIDNESAYYRPAHVAAGDAVTYANHGSRYGHDRRERDDDDHWYGDRRYDGRNRKRRKGGFLSELFD